MLPQFLPFWQLILIPHCHRGFQEAATLYISLQRKQKTEVSFTGGLSSPSVSRQSQQRPQPVCGCPPPDLPPILLTKWPNPPQVDVIQFASISQNTSFARRPCKELLLFHFVLIKTKQSLKADPEENLRSQPNPTPSLFLDEDVERLSGLFKITVTLVTRGT